MTGFLWPLRVSISSRVGFFCVLIGGVVQKLNAQQKEWDEKEEKAGEELLALHNEFARLQSQMAEAASRLSRIRKIRKKVRDRQQEAFERGMQEVDVEDGLSTALDAHEGWVVSDLQALGLPNDPNWTDFGVGEEFADLGPLLSDNAEAPVGSAGGS